MCMFCGNSGDDHQVYWWLPYLMILLPIILLRLKKDIKLKKKAS